MFLPALSSDNSLDLPIQLISEDGKLNDDGLEQFIEMLKYNGPSYAVISIVGPQSSGEYHVAADFIFLSFFYMKKVFRCNSLICNCMLLPYGFDYREEHATE